MEVEIVEMEEQLIAFIEHRGDPLRLIETAIKFNEWRKETGFSPEKDCNTYGVFHTHPAEVKAEDFRFDVCGTVSKPVPENYFDVQNGTIPAGRYAVARHLGHYAGIPDAFKAVLTDWLPRNREKKTEDPCYFHYVNSPLEVTHEDELITDIYVPLEPLKLDEEMN